MIDMAEIINFKDHQRILPKAPTIEELVLQCSDELVTNWERFAKNNQLNDYFLASIGHRADPDVNYMFDRNAIATVEMNLNIPFSLFYPGSLGKEQVGWVAGFQMNGVVMRTPQQGTEQYARCFNILLYLKLRREMPRHGLQIDNT